MASVLAFKRPTQKYSEEDFTESLKSAEVVLFRELSSCYQELQNQEMNIDSLKNLAKIQCALDILQSTNSTEEKAMVYDILKAVKST